MNTPLLRFVPALACVLAGVFAAACLVLPQAAHAQAEADLVLRLNRAEQQVRELTGQVEQLQFRNHQLEQQLRALQGGAPAQQGAASMPQVPQQQASQGASQAPRRDVFDPSQHPNAPGVPRQLGGSAPMIDTPDIGAPGGRAAGAPLDLSNLNAAPPLTSSVPMQPQSQGQPLPRGAGMSPTLPPSQTPKDEFDLGYGYVLRKDYALAEETLRGFLQKYPSDPLAADAQYWLGESLFQRQSYRDAAESFLKVTTGYGDNPSKGAEGLLRLGQSLAALNEREAACAAFGEVNRKYPRAPASVKQGVDREQKRVKC